MPATAERRGVRPGLLAAIGFALAVAGVVGYFVAVVRFGAALPWVRNGALPSWIVVALGVVTAALAMARATRGRRLVPALLFAVSTVVAVAFAAFLYVGLAVPPASGPTVGAPAPLFALADQDGRTLRLEDFRGAPVLLVFYRGHW